MEFRIEQSIVIDGTAEAIWQQIIDLDITAFDHPSYFRWLGIPKPLNAVVEKSGLGGIRTAHFANGNTFAQEITTWDPHERFCFSFRANKGFRVGHLLDLHDGPFQMKSGAYRIEPAANGKRLYLASVYELNGVAGFLLRPPVRMVLYVFQRYLLSGIKKNLEQDDCNPVSAGEVDSR